jgi:predicted ATP-dependent endonuclease of OLD family
MLLRFCVTNHRSLRDRQELSLVASSLDDNPTGLIESRHVPSQKLLPVLVIYGANASGKTNLVNAIGWMRSAVLYSHSRGEPDRDTGRTPFALDPARGTSPSHYAIDFVVDDVRYHYGFDVTNAAFVSEWLFAFPNDRRQALFERDGMHFRFGRNLKGRNQIISELTRPNSLFLSAAAQNGHEELTKISRFFQTIALGESREHELAENFTDAVMDARVIDFLQDAGTGVIDYRLKDIEVTREIREFREGLNSLMKGLLKGRIEELELDKSTALLQLAHRGANGMSVYFDLRQESDGTKRLLGLLVPAFRALDAGAVMVVDELNASLHTQACELVVALFCSPATNPRGAQLIATTHDTNLLQSSHLRRDQVWLTEKDLEGATHLYPLTDFRTRKNDNLERGYLEGRYGAVPFAGRSRDIPAVP